VCHLGSFALVSCSEEAAISVHVPNPGGKIFCISEVREIYRDNKHQLMHQNIYIIFIRESLLHVSSLLGHLQGE
jgi:hypothetical protein